MILNLFLIFFNPVILKILDDFVGDEVDLKKELVSYILKPKEFVDKGTLCDNMENYRKNYDLYMIQKMKIPCKLVEQL